jgi:DNA-directed RNA polymerase specialized sigma24 family protein
MSVSPFTEHSILAANPSGSREPLCIARETTDWADSEQSLAQACLAGVPGAWDVLYSRYHAELVERVRRRLAPRGDRNLSEEIVSRVWYGLVRSNFAVLKRFDPERGSGLSDYFLGIARKEYAAYCRSERRRKIRERLAGLDVHAAAPSATWSQAGVFQEFLARLTKSERMFCLQELRLGEESTLGPASPARPLSEANRRQLRRRVSRKLAKFLTP